MMPIDEDYSADRNTNWHQWRSNAQSSFTTSSSNLQQTQQADNLISQSLLYTPLTSFPLPAVSSLHLHGSLAQPYYLLDGTPTGRSSLQPGVRYGEATTHNETFDGQLINGTSGQVPVGSKPQ